MDFIAFDVETANNKNNSICSIGITLVKGIHTIFCKGHLINPETSFSPMNTKVHGIKASDVENAPTFPEIWEQYKKLFAHYPVVAHGAAFDRSVLEKTAARYNIDLPAILYYDTGAIAKANVSLPDYQLPTLAAHFGITLEKHHDAAADSMAAAEIMSRMAANEDYAIFPLDFASPRYAEKTDAPRFPHFRGKDEKELKQPELDYWQGEVVFEGNCYVFTGDIPGVEREEAQAFVVDHGGRITKSISRKVNYLVVGMEDMSLVKSADGKSGKIREAEENIQKGYDIKIITADSFIKAMSAAK